MLRTFICQDHYLSSLGAKIFSFNSSQFYATSQKFGKGTFICQDDYLLKANLGQKKSFNSSQFYVAPQKFKKCRSKSNKYGAFDISWFGSLFMRRHQVYNNNHK